MNPQEPAQNLRQQITYLIQNFQTHVETCRQNAQQLYNQKPNNLTILEIYAASQSLCGNYQKAIDLYSKCIKLDPQNIAYSNNQAWNYMQLKDFQVAFALLNDIKKKWLHPSIYHNLLAVLLTSRQHEQQYKKERDMFQQIIVKYPRLQIQNKNGLIHTFKMKEQQIYSGDIDRLRTEIFQFVDILLSYIDTPLNFQFVDKRLTELIGKIKNRKIKQQQYGIVIDFQLKVTSQGLEILKRTVICNFSEKYASQLNKYVSKSIEILNQNILKIRNFQNSDYQKFKNQKIIPYTYQLEQIAKKMQEIIQDYQKKYYISQNQNQKDQQKKGQKREQRKQQTIVQWREQRREQKIAHEREQRRDQKKGNYREQKKFQNKWQIQQEIQKANYQFFVRMDDLVFLLQKEPQNVIEYLNLQAENSANPLFSILHMKRGSNQIFYVYLNKNRIRRQILNEPQLQGLRKLQTERQVRKLQKYYYILNLVLKFYNYFGTNNFQYKKKNIICKIDIQNYIQLIIPVLNQIFYGEQLWGDSKVGFICYQIHLAIAKYVTKITQNGPYLRTINHILKIAHLISKQEKPVQSLLKDILEQKNLQYCNMLLRQEQIEIDGSSKYSYFFNSQMTVNDQNYMFKSNFNKDDKWVICNISVLLIGFQYMKKYESVEMILKQIFVDCYYASRNTESNRNIIFRNYYEANHEITKIQKLNIALRKFIRLLI